MRKLSFVAVAAGAAILLYYFYLPTWLLMAAHKTELGGGHFIIIFPPHADPVLRWHGVIVGASVAALGAVGLFVSRDRRRSAWGPALRLGVGILFLGAVVTQTGIQSYVDQLPDPLDVQYHVFADEYSVMGYGAGWPAEEEASHVGADYDKARGAVTVVTVASPGGSRSHAAVLEETDAAFKRWQSRCHQAALLSGATFSGTVMHSPQKWTKYPVIDPATCRVYLHYQGNQKALAWCVRRDSQGMTTVYGSPP